MNIYEYIDNRISRVLDFVGSAVYNIVRYSKISNSSANGQSDKVEGHNNSPGSPTAQDDVRRMGSGGWGLAARPPAGEPCLVARAGGGPLNGVIVACGSARYFPANMADGDVTLYCKQSGVIVYLKASDGSVLISDNSSGTIKVDGSGNVVFNGGSLQVARKTDKVIADATMTTWITAVSTFCGATPPTDFGIINGGAAKVKA